MGSTECCLIVIVLGFFLSLLENIDVYYRNCNVLGNAIFLADGSDLPSHQIPSLPSILAL